MYIPIPQVVMTVFTILGVENLFSGRATFFEPGLGACGKTNTARDLIVALSSQQYGGGGHCGKMIKVHYKGKTVNVKVVDKCPGCGANDIDLSPAAFDKLADESLGVLPITWEFL